MRPFAGDDNCEEVLGRESIKLSLRMGAVLGSGTVPPFLSFAFRTRVARSGLLDVPGERNMERRLV